MASLTIGRYVPYNSFIHKMDPRAKLFALIILMVAIFLPYPTYVMSFTIQGIIFLFGIFLLWRSHVSFFRVLKSLAALWIMVIFVLVIYILVPRTTNYPAFDINGFVIYWDSILEAARILIRLVLMIVLSMALTSSTKPLDLTAALEWYLYPLKLIGFPSHIVAMIISLALRFIPTILDDVERIMKAQSSRGVDFENGHLGTKIKAIVSLIIPLFVSSFIRSDELANAMECRGYDPNAKRTRYRKLHFRFVDVVEVFIVLAIFGGCLTLSIMRLDAFKEIWGDHDLMNYVMVVSYNGAKYFGFEKQKNHPSIQGEIEKALSTYLGYPMTIHGSGRTDKGVHAIGQRCNFKPKKEIKDLNAAVFSLNRLLPKDIFIKSMEKKDDDFDSRHSAAKKVYSYSFHHGPRDPFAVTEYQLEYKKFDFDLFEKAMRIFLGKHDFKNFTPKPIDKDNFIRDILEMTFDLHEGHMRVTLTANGFMTYMVRTMVGVAMRVGEGKMTLEEVKKALDAKERKIISFKADPSGLCLEDVIY